MVRFSNGILTLINLLTLFVSFCSIGLSLWFFVKVGSPCERMVRMPLLVVGGALLLVSMMGLLGACCRLSFFMWIYLITLFFLILGLIALTAFAIAVTNKGIGEVLSQNEVGNGKLGDDSWWLQNYVISDPNWKKIKVCLIDIRLCQTIVGGDNMHYDESYKLTLSPIQSGCCKPPNVCGGNELKNGTGTAHPDCKTWNNDVAELCYNCESCKAAVVENIRKEWKLLAIINTLILISITIIYSIGCCALRNNNNYGYTKYRGYYA